MTWEQMGAIAGIASFVLTFVLHWDRLRGLTITRILVPGLVGIVVFMLFNQIGPMVFGAPTNIPLINSQPTRSPTVSESGASESTTLATTKILVFGTLVSHVLLCPIRPDLAR